MTEERKVWIKICRECGKPFETETYQTLYCSEECKKAGAKKSACRRNKKYRDSRAKKADREYRPGYDSSCGLTYSEWKKQQTIEKFARIDVAALIASVLG